MPFVHVAEAVIGKHCLRMRVWEMTEGCMWEAEAFPHLAHYDRQVGRMSLTGYLRPTAGAGGASTKQLAMAAAEAALVEILKSMALDICLTVDDALGTNIFRRAMETGAL